MDELRIAIEPAGMIADGLEPAVRAAGLSRALSSDQASGLIWCSTSPEGIDRILAANPQIRWVQLLHAGVERYRAQVADGRSWSCAKDAFGPPVAEFALGLLIASSRGLIGYSRRSSTGHSPARSLDGASVAIIGGGGIGRSLASMLDALGSEVALVTRSGRPIGAWPTSASSEMERVVRAADHVVLALPLTEETIGLVDRSFLSWMKPSAWLHNVARGRIVVTEDLVAAIEDGVIAGACLDVTEPEPLADDHPLRGMDQVLITPHCANTLELAIPILTHLIESNCSRFASGEPLLGVIDPEAGY